MFLNLILPKYSDFRRYSAYIVNLDNIPKQVTLDVIPKKTIYLDGIPEKCDFRRSFTKIVILDLIY